MITTTSNIYTTRQTAPIGLQPGNLIGEATYITESQITPPIKQRIRSRKLLSTNISRCQCCCPPFLSGLCRSCLCPCWAYLLIGLLFGLLLAGLAVELAFLALEKFRNRVVSCTVFLNSTNFLSPTNTSLFTSTTLFNPCPPDGSLVGSGSSMWSSFAYLTLIINLFVYLTKH